MIGLVLLEFPYVEVDFPGIPLWWTWLPQYSLTRGLVLLALTDDGFGTTNILLWRSLEKDISLERARVTSNFSLVFSSTGSPLWWAWLYQHSLTLGLVCHHSVYDRLSFTNCNFQKAQLSWLSFLKSLGILVLPHKVLGSTDIPLWLACFYYYSLIVGLVSPTFPYDRLCSTDNLQWAPFYPVFPYERLRCPGVFLHKVLESIGISLQ